MRSVQLYRCHITALMPFKEFPLLVKDMYIRPSIEDYTSTGTTVERYCVARIIEVKKRKSDDGQLTLNVLEIEVPSLKSKAPVTKEIKIESVSNDTFGIQEYDLWVETLKNNYYCLNITGLQYRLMQLSDENDKGLESVFMEVKKDFLEFPDLEELQKLKTSELKTMERKLRDILTHTQTAIDKLTNCVICKENRASIVLLPCKHQAVCENCVSKIGGRCPYRRCGKAVTDAFSPYVEYL